MVAKYDPIKELEAEAENTGKVKVTVQLSQKDYDRVERIAEKLRVSVSDVIRMQIAFPRFLENLESML